MERDSSLHGPLDQPFSLYKSHIIRRNPNKEEPLLSRPNYYTFSLPNFQSKGLLKAPPLSLLHSAPAPFSLQPSPQPPLLPLPLPRRSFSCPPPTIKIGTRKPRNHARSTKSASTSKNNNNSNINIPKKEEKIKPRAPKRSSDSTVTTSTVSSTRNFGPELPKNIAHFDNSVKDGVDMLPTSVVFTISPPPPSSLPLPTFSLRPKLACNAAAAAGIDAGATDDLRRLLRLQ